MFDELIAHPSRFIKYVIRRARQIPSRGFPKLIMHRRDEFDLKYGTDTFGLVRAINTRSPNLVHGNKYEACGEGVVRWSIENCGMEIADTTFIDIGCGKGRVLIVAAMYPFKSIVGIEYSPELARICRRNLEKLKIENRCEVVVADAADYQFPKGNLLVFLYNPFDAIVYGQVLKNLSGMDARIRLANHGPGKDAIEKSGIAFALAAEG